jgi:hypothetical protein
LASRVKADEETDEAYKKWWKKLKQEYKEKKQNIIHQEDRILFRKLKFYVQSSLRLEILESNDNIKIAIHIGRNKLKKLIQ